MPHGDWTKASVELLKTLWARGETATAIGAALGGVSRSAILGKVFRLRLAPVDDPVSRFGRRRAGRRRAAQNMLPPSAVAAPRKSRGLPLLALSNTNCRWPIGNPGDRNFYFCGKATADLEGGRPYCERHARIAYVQRDKTPEKSARTAPPAAARLQRRSVVGVRS